MKSSESSRTIELGTVADYTTSLATEPVRIRVKGITPPEGKSKSKGLYLVPADGGAKQAHTLPAELKSLTTDKFWEWVDEGLLRIVDNQVG